MRGLIAVLVSTGALLAATAAQALPPCSSALACHSGGIWFWNKQEAQYELLISGIEVGGRHYEASDAVCYGIGAHMWGSKGPEFQRFHCSVSLYDNSGNTYPPYGLSLYVQGRYAWTWGRP